MFVYIKFNSLILRAANLGILYENTSVSGLFFIRPLFFEIK